MVALATVVVGLFLGSAARSSGAGASAALSSEPAGAVVVIGTGGVSWSDVSEETTPNLWLLLRDGSSAALSVRSVYSNTCPADGWLGLSAGGRAAAPRAGVARDPANRPCTEAPAVVNGNVSEWPAYEEAAASEKFDTELGLLGDAAAAGGMCVKTVGPWAPVGGASSTGHVDQPAVWSSDAMLEDLNGCPVTLVDVGSLRDPDDVATGEQVDSSREEQLTAIDTRIGQVIEAGPNGADYIVGSLSDAGTSERLRLVVARGPHYGPGLLRSSSTRQSGLAQAQDVTATALSVVGLPVPDAVGGAPLTSDPAPDNSQRRAEARHTHLVDYDEASHDVHDAVEPFFTVFAYGQLVIYLLVLLVWKGRIGSERTRVKVLTRVRVLAVVAASVPVSTFLANLLPWWRFPFEMVSLVASVGLFVAIIATVALRGPWRHWALGPMAIVSATTMAVLAVDVITGSRLELSSLMGLQPVVAGRFYGMGNPTFALFATATILLSTAVSSALVVAGRRGGGGRGGRHRRLRGGRRRAAVLGRRRRRAPGPRARAGLPRAGDPRHPPHLAARAARRGGGHRAVLPRRRRGLAARSCPAEPPRPLRPGDHRRQRDGHRGAQGAAEHRHPPRQRPPHPARPRGAALRHLRPGPTHLVGVEGDAAVLRPRTDAACRPQRAARSP